MLSSCRQTTPVLVKGVLERVALRGPLTSPHENWECSVSYVPGLTYLTSGTMAKGNTTSSTLATSKTGGSKPQYIV